MLYDWTFIWSIRLDVNREHISPPRSSPPEVFLGKGVLKIYSKFTGEHPCRSVISIKLESNFVEITLRHGCSPVNLLHSFRTPFLKNTSGRLLLDLNELIMSVTWKSAKNIKQDIAGFNTHSSLFACKSGR